MSTGRRGDRGAVASGARRDDAPDAVVIGAGHNGLVAANVLADAGWDVVVCEATAHIGGAVRSAEVTAPGFVSDLFSAFHPLAAASPALTDLELERYGLTWSHAPSVLAHVFPDDRAVVLSRDIDQTAASVEQFGRGDGAAWRAMVAQWEVARPHLLDTLFRPFPPVVPAARLVHALGLADTVRMARLGVLSVRRLQDERFDGEGAGMLLAGNALHADLPPDGAGSGVYGWLLSMLGQTYGFPVPVGGSGQLSEALETRLRSAGGSVRLSAAVEQVVLADGAARGVRLETGEVITARRGVLADVVAPVLFNALVGGNHLPRRFVEDLAHFQWDAPTLKIDWALKTPVPWSMPGVAGAGTVHLGVDLDGLTTFASDLASRRVPRHPFILFGQMTTADASRSPAGTESAWGYTHVPTGVDLDDDDIARHVELVEQTVERHAPGFSDSIIGRFVQSPSRLQEGNPNLVSGAINGGTAQLHQQLIFRPVPGLGGAATPIDRLFIAGSSAHPGGGVHGAAGANAARAAIARAGRLGGVRRKGTAALMGRIYR